MLGVQARECPRPLERIQATDHHPLFLLLIIINDHLRQARPTELRDTFVALDSST